MARSRLMGTSVPIRREPPKFRRVEVVRTAAVTPRLLRVTLAGDELDGFTVDEPAASVRLLLPVAGELVMPTWTGNEFLLPDGSRPAIRTLTPRYVRKGELDVDIVLHGGGALGSWARVGALGAISGPGRGYPLDPTASSYVLAGDETAVPAISQLREVIPDGVPITELVGDDLLALIREVPLESGTLVWVAGEAAAVQRVRKYLFEERGIPRSQATVRGYWKRGRVGD